MYVSILTKAIVSTVIFLIERTTKEIYRPIELTELDHLRINDYLN